MFDAKKLFQKRLSQYFKEINRYIKYMINGHMAVAFMFLIVALAVYYQRWLEQLPENFPASLVIAIIYGLLAIYQPIHTLLKEPDLVFLLPAERKMTSYFRHSLIFSYVKSILPMLFIVAAVSPLYFHAYPNRTGKQYLFLVFILLIFKGWNLLAQWWLLKLRDKKTRRADGILRILLSGSIFYFILQGEIVYAGVLTILFIGYLLYHYHLSMNHVGIAWEVLVLNDERRMQLFYRIANLFTEVPSLKRQVKKRRWLTNLVSRLPFKQQFTFTYLYRITFIRSGDYLGLYIRLTVIGCLLIYFIPNGWMKIAFALLFLYLSIFQLVTIYHHYRTNMMVDLYPVPEKMKKEAILRGLFQLTFIQIILFSLLFLWLQLYLYFFLFVVLSVLFYMIFTKGYIHNKLNKNIPL